MDSLPPLQAVGFSRSLDQNRRSGNRHRLRIHADIQIEGPNPTPMPVIVTEISIGGIGLRTKEPLLLEQNYQVHSFDTLLPPGMRVRAVSQRQLPSGEFEVGAKTV